MTTFQANYFQVWHMDQPDHTKQVCFFFLDINYIFSHLTIASLAPANKPFNYTPMTQGEVSL